MIITGYTVYANVEGMRKKTFRSLNRAIEYAEGCFIAQGLGDPRPVSILYARGGSHGGTKVGDYGTYGWREAI